MDGGYTVWRCKKIDSMPEMKTLLSTVPARQRTVNKRMKQFHVCNGRFRHSTAPHSPWFRSVANLTKSVIENGESLFHVSREL